VPVFKLNFIFKADSFIRVKLEHTKPNGPIFGASAAVAAPSPPVTLRITRFQKYKTSLKSYESKSLN